MTTIFFGPSEGDSSQWDYRDAFKSIHKINEAAKQHIKALKIGFHGKGKNRGLLLQFEIKFQNDPKGKLQDCRGYAKFAKDDTPQLWSLDDAVYCRRWGDLEVGFEKWNLSQNSGESEEHFLQRAQVKAAEIEDERRKQEGLEDKYREDEDSEDED